MKCLLYLRFRMVLWGFGMLAAVSALTASAGTESGQLLVKSVQGRVMYSMDRQTWLPLEPDVILERGVVLKTESDSTADLTLTYSKTVLRITENTALELYMLHKTIA